MRLFIYVFFIQTLSFNLNKPTKELSDFKLVMQTIDTIQTTSISREIKIKDLQETYTIMSEHKIKVSRNSTIIIIIKELL